MDRSCGDPYLSRKDGAPDANLYWWDETGSAWRPDTAKAHVFVSPAKVRDLAVICGGRNNAGQISVGETSLLSEAP